MSVKTLKECADRTSVFVCVHFQRQYLRNTFNMFSIKKSECCPLFFSTLIEDTLIHNNHNCGFYCHYLTQQHTSSAFNSDRYCFTQTQKAHYSVSCGTRNFQWRYRDGMQNHHHFNGLLMWKILHRKPVIDSCIQAAKHSPCSSFLIHWRAVLYSCM